MGITGVASQPVLNRIAGTRSYAPEKRIAAASKCFHAIAVLSLIYAANVLLTGDARNILALGTSSAIAIQPGGTDIVLTLIISCWMAGLFTILGLFAECAENWAFIAGIAAYSGDGALLVRERNFAALAFHIIALLFMATLLTRISDSAVETELGPSSE